MFIIFRSGWVEDVVISKKMSNSWGALVRHEVAVERGRDVALDVGFCSGRYRQNRQQKDTNPYTPCMVYLPTFGWFLGHMLVNMPYVEHMGYGILCVYIYGWWFGTMEFYDFLYIGNVIIPTDELIFFRGIETTNQIWIWYIHMYIYIYCIHIYIYIIFMWRFLKS